MFSQKIGKQVLTPLAQLKSSLLNALTRNMTNLSCTPIQTPSPFSIGTGTETEHRWGCSEKREAKEKKKSLGRFVWNRLACFITMLVPLACYSFFFFFPFVYGLAPWTCRSHVCVYAVLETRTTLLGKEPTNWRHDIYVTNISNTILKFMSGKLIGRLDREFPILWARSLQVVLRLFNRNCIFSRHVTLLDGS